MSTPGTSRAKARQELRPEARPLSQVQRLGTRAFAESSFSGTDGPALPVDLTGESASGAGAESAGRSKRMLAWYIMNRRPAPAPPPAPVPAPAPAPLPPAPAPLMAPFISQYDPSGDPSNFAGTNHCILAAIASLGRIYGKGAGLTDYQLVADLGTVGLTDQFPGNNGQPVPGTAFSKVPSMLDYLGLPYTVSNNPDMSWIDSQLAAGKPIMLIGDFLEQAAHPNPNRTTDHAVVVSSKNTDGSYNVMDPAYGHIRMSLGELISFQTQAFGNFAVSVG